MGIGIDNCRDWLFKRGYHANGDFHVQFGNGGTVDLAEVLSDFAEDIANEIAEIIKK